MTATTQVLKNVTARAWNDIEPKLITWLTTGLTVTGIVQYGDVVGLHVAPAQAALAVVVIGTIAGYFKHSTSTVRLDEPAPTTAPIV
jgi:hypothetical protein